MVLQRYCVNDFLLFERYVLRTLLGSSFAKVVVVTATVPADVFFSFSSDGDLGLLLCSNFLPSVKEQNRTDLTYMLSVLIAELIKHIFKSWLFGMR